MRRHITALLCILLLAGTTAVACKKKGTSTQPPPCSVLRFDTSLADDFQDLAGNVCRQVFPGGSLDYHVDKVSVWLDKCTSPSDTVTLYVEDQAGNPLSNDTQSPGSSGWWLDFFPRDSGGNKTLIVSSQTYFIRVTCTGTCAWGINKNPTLPTLYHLVINGTIQNDANFCTKLYSEECQ